MTPTPPPHVSPTTPAFAYAVLAVGDLAVFVLFNIMGRADHEASITAFTVAKGVAPFAVAWFAVSPWIGTYRHATFTSFRRTWQDVLPAWVLCGALALLLRMWWYDRPFIATFAAISLSFQAGLLMAWRMAFLAVSLRSRSHAAP
ncbi:MAG: DUF3054 domain-containing protein [Chloroflexi bacterium]|nr:DUF3054 domain-containing protein [Chloroflexota bacterium]